MSLVGDIKKAAKRVGRLEGDFKRLFKRVDDIDDTIKSIQRARSWAGSHINNLDDQLSDLPKQIERESEKTARRVFEELKEDVEDLVEDAIDSFASALAKEGLEEFRDLVKCTKEGLDKLRSDRPELVDEIDNLSVYLELGPVTMTWEGFYTRAEQVSGVLDHYVNHPPSVRRKDILEFIAAVGPTSVDTGISIQAAFVVASSKELSIGAGLGEIRLALFLELGDLILDELGVPA